MTEHKKTQKSKFCVECGKTMKQNDKEEWFCPSCGYKLEKKTVNKEYQTPQKEKSNTFAICCGGAIVFFIIIMIIGSLNDSGDTYSSSSSSYKSASSNSYCGFMKSDRGRTSIGQDCPAGERCVETECAFVTVTTDAGRAYACDGICK